MKCTLSVEVNKCPFCDKDKMECHNEENCSFKKNENIQTKEKYVRQERWYEKYYRKK